MRGTAAGMYSMKEERQTGKDEYGKREQQEREREMKGESEWLDRTPCPALLFLESPLQIFLSLQVSPSRCLVT